MIPLLFFMSPAPMQVASSLRRTLVLNEPGAAMNLFSHTSVAIRSCFIAWAAA